MQNRKHCIILLIATNGGVIHKKNNMLKFLNSKKWQMMHKIQQSLHPKNVFGMYDIIKCYINEKKYWKRHYCVDV